MGMTKRVAVFIDASNFYYKLRSLKLSFLSLTQVDFAGVATWLARERALTAKYYYVADIQNRDDEKSQSLLKDQQRLFEYLQSPKQGFEIRHGFLMKKGEAYVEKGTDVQMAVDMLVGAYENKYDIAIMVSSDTDLIPVIRQIRNLGKDVEYIGVATEPSYGLQNEVTLSRLLRPEDLRTFVQET
jgi:uncharacterized LabA/DUF88 family protein